MARLKRAAAQELDIGGLAAVVAELEIIEKDWDARYDELINGVLSECHERIKHAQL